jgi:hypothetical protein
VDIKKILRDRARASALRVLSRELVRLRESLTSEPETVVDFFNSGVRVNIKAAKRRGYDLALEIIEKQLKNSPGKGSKNG